jgi:ABC-2 type transport system ATP-binding protein
VDVVQALRGVDLDVAQGEVHGLLGPNAAGKTTLCRILATTLLPTRGSVRVLGLDVVRDVAAVRRSIGLVFGGDRGFYPRLTARQNLSFWAVLYGVPVGRRRQVVTRLLDRVGLAERGDERVEGYSRGMRQRLHLARGLVGDPPLLILDEPTTGMDPVAALEFRALIAELRAEGKSILLTTHNMPEAEQVCDRVTLIADGTVLATERPAALSVRLRAGRRIEAEDVPESVVARLTDIPGTVVVARRAPGHVCVEAAPPAVLPVLRVLIDAGVVSLRASLPDLEEVYLALIGERGLAVPR